MVILRNPLSRAVQIGGVVATAALTSVVRIFLPDDLGRSRPYMLGSFALLCLLVHAVALSWLERRIIRPLGVVSSITLRIADGDLTVAPADSERLGGGPATDAGPRRGGGLHRL